MNKIALFFTFIFLLSGCSADRYAETQNVNADVNNSAKLYGVDFSEDTTIENIDDFEMTVAKQDVYADSFYINEGDEVERFMLECCAKGKIPFIELKNGCADEESMKKYADAMAESIGRYKIRVIIGIDEGFGADSGFYEYMSDKCRENNSLSEIAWICPSDCVMAADKYVNNADYVCFKGAFANEGEVKRFTDELKKWYKIDIPVIVLTGAESYCKENCSYTIEEACGIIGSIYGALSTDDKTEMIIYVDGNCPAAYSDNEFECFITFDKRMTERYAESSELSNAGLRY